MAELALKWDGVKLSGTADTQTADVTYVVFDVAHEQEAILAVLVGAPSTLYGIPITDMATADRLSEDTWLVSVKYSTKLSDQKKESKDAGAPEPTLGTNYEIEFEAAAVTTHITRSLSTKQQVQTTVAIGDPASIPDLTDFANAINDTGESVEGCDFPPEPHFRWSETHYLSVASINDEYVRTLEEMVGFVNDEVFRNRDPGCVLFRGVSGKRKDTVSYALTFRFESRRAVVNETIGPFEGVNADGYDYVWVRKVPTKSSDGKRIVMRDAQLNVEEVAIRADFTELGIGVAGLDP